MNIFMWVLAGGVIGWIAYARFGYNEERGRNVSIIIGAAGAFLGGHLLAPMFSAPAAVPGDFSTSALIFAGAAAIASIFAGNLIHKRWGV